MSVKCNACEKWAHRASTDGSAMFVSFVLKATELSLFNQASLVSHLKPTGFVLPMTALSLLSHAGIVSHLKPTGL